jgi:Fatty acid hydroxylase superfamily
MQWWPASWPEEQQNQLHRALIFSGAVCLALVVSHLSMTAYIAYHDLTGRWDKYSLKFQHNTVWTYLAHASSFFADVAVLLGPSLVLFGYYYDAALWEPLLKHGGHWWRDGVRICALLLAAVINNIINRLWAMLVHWVMHMNKHLYQWVHRRHHCSIRELCALSAWQDTWLEFLLMEVLGVFLFAQLFNPLPWHFHVLLAAYNGIGGAIDHSAFYIPGTWIDGR